MKQWPILDTTSSNRYHVRTQVHNVKSYCIQSARDNITEVNDLHRFESAAESLEFINSILAENRYIVPVAECVKCGVCGPNPKLRESKAANQ
jgi:hypothetical protein